MELQHEFELITSAMAELTETFRQACIPMNEAFREAMERARRAAFAADPGLEFAWHRAQKLDPNIGWLDVARIRNAEWWEFAPGTELP